MLKKFLIIIPFLIAAFFPAKLFALTPETFITITNPVRGQEGWVSKTSSPLDLPIYLYEESTKSGLPSNWLLRYDAITDATISAYFKNIVGQNKLESIGGLLEITPKLTQKVNVRRANGNKNMLYLSGYTQSERILLIDGFMDSFKNIFGFYPRSVGAWHLDSYSLCYLQRKYSVQTAMIIDDQYSTEQARLWGGYLGSPYFPDKNNSLVPAASFDTRINLAVVRWAQRDLFNILNSKLSSRFSVEPGDYLRLGLDSEYFEKLLFQYSQKGLNKFTYLNVGLQNDEDTPAYRQEIKKIFASLVTNKEKLNLRFSSLSDFGNWMISFYPESSPVYFYRTKDPTGNNMGEVTWYQTPFYRLGLKAESGKTNIVDFRIYNRDIYEDYFNTANQFKDISAEIPALVDSVKFPESSVLLGIDLEKFKTEYSEIYNIWNISLVEGDKIITLSPKSITFSNIDVPNVNFSGIKEEKSNASTTWTLSPKTPFKNLFSSPIILGLIVLFILKICFAKDKIIGIGALISFAPLIMVLKDSRLYPFGLGYWGSNAHDAVFHLSIIEKISQNPLSLSHPQLAGEKLSNYHFVFDYLAGLLVRLTHIPSFQIYFFILPLFIAILLTVQIVKLLRVWKFKDMEILLSLFFVFLAGSFGFILSAISANSIFSGESAFWANQSISIFLNPPYALSVLFLVSTLLLLEKYFIKKTTFRLIGIILLGGLLAQTKVYAFILLVAGLLFSGQWLMTTLVGLVGIVITIPFSSSMGFPFEFSPFWFIRSMFASSDRLNLSRVAYAWQAYEATGSIVKLLLVNIFGILLFLFGNIGTRILGVYEILKGKPTYTSQKILIIISVFGILIPVIFIQRYNPWNSIQFMYYSLFVFGLFSGRGVLRFLGMINKTVGKIIVLSLIIIFTLLTTIGSIKEHIGYWPPARVDYTEIEALTFLRSIPRGTVLAPYFNGDRSGFIFSPRPLYAYASTAYISALSGQSEYLSDTINLDITGYDYKERAKNVQRFYNTSDIEWAKNFLVENEIKYIYETPITRMKLDPVSLSLTKIFDSVEINIYKQN